MKLLKGFLFFILILLAAGLLAALFAPSSKMIERSVQIDAPASKVFQQIANFKNWPHWDPWYSKDTNQVRTYIGTVGDKTYGYTWKSGNKNVGEGGINMLSVVGQEELNYELNFKNGTNNEKAMGSFKLAENENKTKVTWNMISKKSYPMNIMNYFMDGMIGPDFEEGLKNLKSYVENAKDEDIDSETSGIQIVTEHGINYAIVKSANLAMTDMDPFFKTAYPQIYGYIQTNGLAPKGPSRALYYNWNEEEGLTTLAAAVPISDLLLEEGIDADIGVGTAQLKSNSIEFVQMGGYSTSYVSHGAMDSWITLNNKTLATPIVEEYIKGPNETSDTNLFETKIIYYFE